MPPAGEATLISPRHAPPPASAATPVAPPPEVDLPATGAAPLLDCAAPLLQLLARLRNILSQPDPAALRANVIRALNDFEKAARAASVSVDQLRSAHYALCASLDDVVLNTPWGSQGAWAARPLTATFHQEERSGERFFDLLAHARRDAATKRPLLELFYLCMSLGYAGRYRASSRSLGEFERLRADIHAQIHRQRSAPVTLSLHWKGVFAPYRPKHTAFPIWVAGIVGAACLGALFTWFSLGLNQLSDTLYERALASPPAHMPQIARAAPVEPPKQGPPPPEGDALDQLRAVLKPVIDTGFVTVAGTDAVPVIRVAANSMFAPRGATVLPRFVPLLADLGAVLKDERGRIEVIGYTDNRPIRTMEFPSNFQLSAARARAAAALIGKGLGDSDRVHAEGRADADPIAPNTTPQGRERNRRIELVLHRAA